MNRRDFLKLMMAGAASLAAPNLLAHGLSNIESADEYIHIKSVADKEKTGDSDAKIITFSKDGYQDIIKLCVVSGCMQAVASSDREIKIEMAYQIAKKMREAIRDYLYMEYSTGFRKHETPEYIEKQMMVFMDDLDKLQARM